MPAEGIVYRQITFAVEPNRSRLVKINRPSYFESISIRVPFVSPALGKFPAELVEVLETTLLFGPFPSFLRRGGETEQSWKRVLGVLLL